MLDVLRLDYTSQATPEESDKVSQSTVVTAKPKVTQTWLQMSLSVLHTPTGRYLTHPTVQFSHLQLRKLRTGTQPSLLVVQLKPCKASHASGHGQGHCKCLLDIALKILNHNFSIPSRRKCQHGTVGF